LSQSGTRKSAQKVLSKPQPKTRQESTAHCSSNYCAGVATKRGNSETKKLRKVKKSKENDQEIKKLEKRVDTLSTNIARL
jgi:hypothetical protein